MGAAQLLLLANARRTATSPAAWTPAVFFTSAFALGFLVGTPYAVLDHGRFSADLAFDFTHLSGGHGIDLGRGWVYHLRRSLPYGVGIPTCLAALAGLVPFARRFPRHAVVLGAFALAFYASIGSGYTVFFRYVLPLVPVICLVAAIGTTSAGAWLATRMRVPHAVAIGLLAALVALPSLVQSTRFDRLLARTDTRVVTRDWLAPRLQAEDSLHDAGGNYSRLDLADLRFHQWVFDPATASFGHPEGASPDWLVLHESPLRVYASTPTALRQLAEEKYDLVFTAPATTRRSASAVYDLQDAFFLPMSGLGTVERPGPTIRVYRRRGAPPIEGGTR